MCRWSESDQHDTRLWVPEPGYWAPPVLLVTKGCSALDSDAFTPLDQPGTPTTLRNFAGQECEGIHMPKHDTQSRTKHKPQTSGIGWHLPATVHGVASPKNRPTLMLLVRHGKTPTTGVELYGRRPGVHLSDVGQGQATAVAERIAALGKGRIDAIYASPLERTRETAAPIAKACGLRVRGEEGLIELDMGDWTGRKLSDLRKLKAWTQVQQYPSGFTFPNGESFPQMQTRMAGAVGELVAKHPGKTVVAVSHADPIRALVAHAMGTHIDLFQRIVVSPCSVTAILFGTNGPTVLAVNSTSALTDLAPA